MKVSHQVRCLTDLYQPNWKEIFLTSIIDKNPRGSCCMSYIYRRSCCSSSIVTTQSLSSQKTLVNHYFLPYSPEIVLEMTEEQCLFSQQNKYWNSLQEPVLQLPVDLDQKTACTILQMYCHWKQFSLFKPWQDSILSLYQGVLLCTSSGGKWRQSSKMCCP